MGNKIVSVVVDRMVADVVSGDGDIKLGIRAYSRQGN
jgi:hypothetical protein